MQISYLNQLSLNRPPKNTHRIQIELSGTAQWKKGMSAISLVFQIPTDKRASTVLNEWFRKNPLVMKCPKDRKLCAAIMEDILTKFPFDAVTSKFATTRFATASVITDYQKYVSPKYTIEWDWGIQDDDALDENYALLP